MAMFKRIGLFLLTNILVVLTLSLITQLFGIEPYINQYGLNTTALAQFCLIWGMGGAFISLLMSRFMAKMAMGVKVIDPNTTDPTLSRLVQSVHAMSRAAGLPKMPEVGYYESPELNAFATGPSKSRALVAVSTGLLDRMSWDEVEGVLGHEIAHVANGDMVTLTLIQGVVNAFVMFLARIIAFALTMAGRGNSEERRGGSPFMYHITVMLLEMVFMLLGSMVVAWFSRQREFRADAGGARFAGREKMIGALEKLRRAYEITDPNLNDGAIQAFKISGNKKGFLALFSTHPPLEERIRRLEYASG